MPNINDVKYSAFNQRGFRLLDVLKKGNMVKNPEFWKKMQYRVTLLASLIPVLARFYPAFGSVFTPEVLTDMYTALGAFNVYFTIATTEKIGL